MKSWEQFYIEFVLKHAEPLKELPKGYGVYIILDLI